MAAINIYSRPFDCAKELDEQRQLFIDCFPECTGMPITTREYYYWKFHSFPSEGEKSYEYIAVTDGNEMVGYYACVPYRYLIDGKEYIVGMVCDVMTSSKYRGVGIFTKLGRYSTDEFKKEGLAFSTGYPIRKAPLPGHMKVGWKVVFDMPLYIRFFSLTSFLKARGYGWAKYFANPFVWLYNVLCFKRANKDIEIKVYNDIEQVCGYIEFEKEWRSSIKNVLIKDIPFMKWRFSAPQKQYNFVCAYKNNRLVGMTIATAIVKEGVPSYGLVDFMVLPEHRDCLNSIHNKLKRMSKENHKEAIMTMMSKPSVTKYKMLGNAFLKSPFTFHYIIKKYDETISDEVLYDINNWELRFVDSDDL